MSTNTDVNHVLIEPPNSILDASTTNFVTIETKLFVKLRKAS